MEGAGTAELAERSNWVAVPNPEGVVREVKEKKVVSREETEEVKETEDIQHLGDISDEVSRYLHLLKHICSFLNVNLFKF